VLIVFAVSIFVSAALLFLVQPMSGKFLLPLLGGAPSVWNACMVFFQAVLLLGYGYSHVLTTRLSSKFQALVHGGLLVVAGLSIATLAVPIDVGSPTGDPTVWLIKTLLITIGLPFLAVSTTGPLLQRWFSRTTHRAARDPYFLNAASNFGSVIGLLAYPFLIEPSLSRNAQARLWGVGFAAFGLAVLACAWLLLRHEAPAARGAPGVEPGGAPGAGVASDAGAGGVTWRRRGWWVLLAFVPSSLMLGVTQHVSTDIAPIPLMWIVPLLIYLITFIVAFAPRVRLSARAYGRALPYAAIAAALTLLISAREPVLVLIALHVGLFALAAMMCHKRLADDRPDPSRLTEFYLMMSVGGVLGGIFNALIAPNLFDSIVEYPLVIGLACLLRPQTAVADARASLAAKPSPARPAWRGWVVPALAGVLLFASVLIIEWAFGAGWVHETRVVKALQALVGPEVMTRRVVTHLAAAIPLIACVFLLPRGGNRRWGLGMLGALTASALGGGSGTTLLQERGFFGVVRISANESGTWHTMSHGTTLHGVQSREPTLSKIPTSYYHPTGPIGDVMKLRATQGRVRRGGFIGLGAGSMAAYILPGARFDFYDIDPMVVALAKDPRYFTYLSDAKAKGDNEIAFSVGDGRINLEAEVEDGTYDVIVLDAFTSDAIPIHLVTKEAIELYFRKLQPDGIVAIHISNRYFDLSPVLARLASEVGAFAIGRQDTELADDAKGQGKLGSIWVAMARTKAVLNNIPNRALWIRLEDRSSYLNEAGKYPLWTDDYSNPLSVFRPFQTAMFGEAKRPPTPPAGAAPQPAPGASVPSAGEGVPPAVPAEPVPPPG